MINLFAYNETQQHYFESNTFDALKDKFDKNHVNWVNVEISQREELDRVANHFGLHPLLLDDIFNTEHLPKMERFEDYIFITLKMFSFKPDSNLYCREHISMVLGDGYVLTFQQILKDDVFDGVRDRILNNKGILRKHGADYLFYRLLDAVVDNYLLIAEDFRRQIEDLEDTIYRSSSENQVADIIELKREINAFRKETVPVREEIGRLKADSGGLIKKATHTYLQDVYDHLNHLSSNFEVFREMIKDLMDLNMANMSNNLNKVMKTLTVVASIFIPLTFIAGIYGMNFEYMPELAWPWAYPVLMLLMLLLSLGMIFYMRKKKWF